MLEFPSLDIVVGKSAPKLHRIIPCYFTISDVKSKVGVESCSYNTIVATFFNPKVLIGTIAVIFPYLQFGTIIESCFRHIYYIRHVFAIGENKAIIIQLRIGC